MPQMHRFLVFLVPLHNQLTRRDIPGRFKAVYILLRDLVWIIVGLYMLASA